MITRGDLCGGVTCVGRGRGGEEEGLRILCAGEDSRMAGCLFEELANGVLDTVLVNGRGYCMYVCVCVCVTWWGVVDGTLCSLSIGFFS